MVKPAQLSARLLTERQRLVAALSTDGRLRTQLQTDPDTVLTAHGLPTESRKTWLALLPEIARFARSLIAKRRGEARHWLPWIVACLGRSSFDQAFSEYSAQSTPSGNHKPKHDAFGFCEWLLSNDRVFEDQPWRRAIVIGERDRLQMASQRWGFRLRFYRYDVLRWNPETPASPPPQKACWLFAWAVAGERGCWRMSWF